MLPGVCVINYVVSDQFDYGGHHGRIVEVSGIAHNTLGETLAVLESPRDFFVNNHPLTRNPDTLGLFPFRQRVRFAVGIIVFSEEEQPLLDDALLRRFDADGVVNGEKHFHEPEATPRFPDSFELGSCNSAGGSPDGGWPGRQDMLCDDVNEPCYGDFVCVNGACVYPDANAMDAGTSPEPSCTCECRGQATFCPGEEEPDCTATRQDASCACVQNEDGWICSADRRGAHCDCE